MNKKAFELSANFLVIMILSIVMLGFGVYFTKQIFDRSHQLELQLDEQTNQRIEELMNDGSKVVVPFTTKTAKRDSLVVFGVGFLNVLGHDEEFWLSFYDKDNNEIMAAGSLTPALFFEPDGDAGGSGEEAKIALLVPRGFTEANMVNIKNNERQTWKAGADVAPDAPSGTYVVNVKVRYMDDDGNYRDYTDSVQKLYIVIP